MKFYKILWLVILVFTLGLQAQLLPSMSPVFNLRSLTLRQIIPVSYRTTLGLFQRCYKCHTKHNHPNNTLTAKYIQNNISTKRFSNLNNTTPRPSPSMKPSFRRVYDADKAYVDLESFGAGRFKTTLHQKSKTFQNFKPDDNKTLKNKLVQQLPTIPKNYESVKTKTDSNKSEELIEKSIETGYSNGVNVEVKHKENYTVVHNTQNKDFERIEDSEGKDNENYTVVGNAQNKDSERIEDFEGKDNDNYTVIDNTQNKDSEKIEDSKGKDNDNYTVVDNTQNKDSERIEDSVSVRSEDFDALVNITATNADEDEIYLLFIATLDQFESNLLATNFDKFTSMSTSRGDSGMSFVQSGLFLGMVLMALSTEVDIETKNEIDQNLKLNVSDQVKIKVIKQVISSLPESTEELKFRWVSRLVLRSSRQLSGEFVTGAARALHLKFGRFEGTETPAAMAMVLNKMIEADSGGSIRNTFEEDDLTQNEEAVLITTLYFRARWRSSPTLLNRTRPFQDSGNVPRTVRMIRINDVMNYVDLPEWEAEAIEISYSTKGLSLLMLIPRGNSIKSLVEHVTNASISVVTDRMQSIRIAAVLPLYTLRMTLLLPNKLQAMGISRLVDAKRSEVGESLRLSQAVQRIMFWAEAGRNAYKDDGLEWDEPPSMKMVIDRPYIFFVRWQNMTLLNGNFVL